MRFQVPDYIRSLVPYVPGKPIEETQREFGLRRVIKLASNENPLGPSPKALAAIRKALPELHRYPDASGYRLKSALAAHHKLTPQSVILGNGSNEIIDFLIRAYCVPGDSIVTSQAAFVAYKICAQIQGVRTVEAPMTEDLRFDLGRLAELVRADERARIVFIANPNNPTGTYVNRAELVRFLKEIESIRGDSVVVALDYAYWEYVTAADLPDPHELMKQFPNVVVLRTFSKVYGLAGTRVGYATAHPEIISVMEKIRQPFNMNSMALVAAEAALSDRAFVLRSRKLNQAGMAYWAKQLDRMGLPFWKSQGNFILVDVSQGSGRLAGDVYLACLRRGVIFRPVANYGMKFALRISIGTAEENRIAARALAEVMGAATQGAAPRRAHKKGSARRGRSA